MSLKTIERIIKEIDDLRYVGSGYSGHWEKTGAENVAQGDAQGVAQGVAQDVAQDKNSLIEFIKKKVRNNDRVTRKEIADEAGVSLKTIERIIKEIDDLRYVGSGYSGHWEKTGAENVPQDVPQDTTHQTNDFLSFIKKEKIE